MLKENNIGVLILNAMNGRGPKISEFSNFDDGILEKVGTVYHYKKNNPLI